MVAFMGFYLISGSNRAPQPADNRDAKAVLADIERFYGNNDKRWRAVRWQTQQVMLKKFANAPEAPKALLLYAKSTEDLARVYKGEAGKWNQIYSAVQVYRELKQKYPESPEWLGVGARKETELIAAYSDYNRSKPGYSLGIFTFPNQYNLMDAMVRLTGKIPWFSYAFSMLLVAVFVNLLLWPIKTVQFKSMREMYKVQPLMREIQQKYKGEEQQRRMMEMYREHNISPFASCLSFLTLFLQIPFFIWVYNAIRAYEFEFAKGEFLWIGSSVSHQYPNYIATSLGVQDTLLLLIYAASMFVSQRLMPVSDAAQAEQQKKMATFMTLIMLVMLFQWGLPSAFVLYWICLNVIATFQQLKYVTPQMQGMAAEHAAQAVAKAAPAPNQQVNSNGRSNVNGISSETNGEKTRLHSRKKKR